MRLNPTAIHAAAVVVATLLTACSGSPAADPGSRQVSLRVADAAMASGAPDLALRVADLVLAQQPATAPALIARGDALYAMGRPGAAGVAYRSAIALDSTAAAAQLGLGRTLIAADPKAAEVAFLRVLALEPENLAALNDLGVARDLQGRYAAAQQAYRLALQLSPASADVRINLGRSLALANRKPEATSVLREVAEDPTAGRTWRRNLMAALEMAGDGAWARQALADEALEARQALAGASNSRQLPATPEPAAVALANAHPAAHTTDHQKEISSESRTQRMLTFPIDASPAGLAADVPPYEIRPVIRIGVSDPVAAAPWETQPRQSPHSGRATKPDQSNATRTDAPHGGTYVQVASLHSEAGAVFERQRLKVHRPLLADREFAITTAEVHDRTWWRLRAFGFRNIAEADSLCRRLQTAGVGCWAGRKF